MPKRRTPAQTKGIMAADMVKKLLAQGVNLGANLGSLNLEILQGMLGAVDRLKSELGDIVQAEVKKAMDKVDFRHEMDRFLQGHDVEVSMKIRFKKK